MRSDEEPYGADVDEAQDQGRHIAFGRFVKRARDRWLQANPGKGVREFCAFTGVSSPTLYRWINGSWNKDPDRATVDTFATRLNIPVSLPHGLLGWTGQSPAREIPEPELDADVVAIGRKLADPDVPESEKVHIREMLRFLAQRRST